MAEAHGQPRDLITQTGKEADGLNAVKDYEPFLNGWVQDHLLTPDGAVAEFNLGEFTQAAVEQILQQEPDLLDPSRALEVVTKRELTDINDALSLIDADEGDPKANLLATGSLGGLGSVIMWLAQYSGDLTGEVVTGAVGSLVTLVSLLIVVRTLRNMVAQRTLLKRQGEKTELLDDILSGDALKDKGLVQLQLFPDQSQS